MGAIRYQTNGYSIDGIQYRISIYDKTYSGAIVSDFILDSNFFELRYDSGADENYSPIIGSELTLNIELFKSPARNDTNLFTFLKNMIAQNSQTYYIIIEEYISGTWVNYWRGNVVQDQSTWNNDALEGGKSFKVTANDFSFLNEIPFELLTPGTVGEYPLRSMMNAALTKLGIYDDFSGDILYYFLHNINWYETTIPLLDRPNTDILYDILTNDSNFTELNEDQTQNTINYIEVLKTICVIFGCRLIQSNGKFWAIQMSNYANSTSKFWQRGIDNNNNTTVTVSPRIAVDNTSGPLKILEGGSYTGIRPYYSVFVEKPRLNNLLVPENKRDVDASTQMEATVTAIDVLGGQSNKLQVVFDTQAFTYFNGAGAPAVVDGTYIAGGVGVGKQRIPPNNFVSTDVYVRIRIKVKGTGTYYYLANSGGNYVWTTTTSAVQLNYPIVKNFDGILAGSLITAVLPAFTFDELFVYVYPYFSGYLSNGTSFAQGPGYFKGTFSCLFLEKGMEGDNTVYRATISPKPFDPTEKQLDKVYLYDNQRGGAKGLMTVNYPPTNPATRDWISGLSIGSTFYLLELAVLNALAQNRAVKEIITATIKGNYYPHQLLTYDSKQWHLKQATYNAGSNQWNGEWWELQYDETNITTVANEADGDWTDTVLIG